MKLTGVGVRNAVAAAVRVAYTAIKGDQLLVDPATKKKRFSICEGCEYRDGIQCSICECLVRAKTMLTTETCPKGKW